MERQENRFADIYEIVKLVPRGRVTTYGAIAAYIGIKSGARFVGWAMNACHGHSDVPAHRVVNRNGMLTGKHHFPTSSHMARLLQQEGILVKDDRIVNFQEVLWLPLKELI